VGANGRAGHLVTTISDKGSPGCLIEGFLDDDPERQAILEKLGVQYLGKIEALDQLMIERVIDCVYVCLPLRSSYDTAQGILDLCEAAGVPVFMVADLLPLHTETDALWCTETPSTACLAAPQREAPEPAPRPTRDRGVAPLLTALSAAFSGLAYGRLVLSRQRNEGGPRPPESM
jgi:hypothetical protein